METALHSAATRRSDATLHVLGHLVVRRLKRCP